MAAAAYSVRWYSGVLQPASNWVTLFKVPAGQRAVLRFISVTQGMAAGALTAFALQSNGAEVFRVASLASYDASATDVRIVFFDGETCLGRAYVNPSTVHISGYILDSAGAPTVPGQLPVPPGS